MTIQDKLPRFLRKPYAFLYGALSAFVRSPLEAIERGFEAVALVEPEPEEESGPRNGERFYVNVTGSPRPGYMITGRMYLNKETAERAKAEGGIKHGQTLSLEETREFLSRYVDEDTVKAWDEAMDPKNTDEYRAVIAKGEDGSTRFDKQTVLSPDALGYRKLPEITTAQGNRWLEIPEVMRGNPYLIVDGDEERKVPVPAWMLEQLGYQPGQSISKLEMLAVAMTVLEARSHYPTDTDFNNNTNRRKAA